MQSEKTCDSCPGCGDFNINPLGAADQFACGSTRYPKLTGDLRQSEVCSLRAQLAAAEDEAKRLREENERLKKVGRTALHRLRMLDRAGRISPRGVDPNYACGNHDVMRELIDLVAPELKEPADDRPN